MDFFFLNVKLLWHKCVHCGLFHVSVDAIVCVCRNEFFEREKEETRCYLYLQCFCLGQILLLKARPGGINGPSNLVSGPWALKRFGAVWADGHLLVRLVPLISRDVKLIDLWRAGLNHIWMQSVLILAT